MMDFRASILSIFLLLAVVAAAAAPPSSSSSSSSFGQKESDREKELIVANPFVCQPGSRFKVDCNTCRCGNVPGMLGACTRINCLVKEGECIPKAFFMVGDKLCRCPDSRMRAESDCFVQADQ